eukprot:tig00000863_g5002.t1
MFARLRERLPSVPLPSPVQKMLSGAAQRAHSSTEGLRLVGTLAQQASRALKTRLLGAPTAVPPAPPRVLAFVPNAIEVFGQLLPGAPLVTSLKAGAGPTPAEGGGPTYTWQRGVNGTYEAIADATREIYHVTVFDIGCSLRLTFINGPISFDLDLGIVQRDEAMWKEVLGLLAQDVVEFPGLLRVTEAANAAAALRLTRKGLLLDAGLVKYGAVGVFCDAADGCRLLVKTKEAPSACYVFPSSRDRDLFCLAFRTLRDDWVRRKEIQKRIQESGGMLSALAIQSNDWPAATLGGGAAPTMPGPAVEP